jgi:small subunit ribosomal protein S16
VPWATPDLHAHEFEERLHEMLRMRLRRTGAKKQPSYRVVIAEARTPRDGAFVDSIGFYDPLTEPATIRIDRDKALDWIRKGAQPSDTVVRLLRRSGIVEGGPERSVAPSAQTTTPSAAAPAPAEVPNVAAASGPETTPEATDERGSSAQ